MGFFKWSRGSSEETRKRTEERGERGDKNGDVRQRCERKINKKYIGGYKKEGRKEEIKGDGEREKHKTGTSRKILTQGKVKCE